MITDQDKNELRREFVTRRELTGMLGDIACAWRRVTEAFQRLAEKLQGTVAHDDARHVAARLKDASDTVSACQHDVDEAGQP